MTAIEVTRLHPAVGAEVRGLDLTRPLAAEDQDALRAAFAEHQLLLVRGQDLSDTDHVRLMSYLGPVQPAAGTSKPLVDSVDNRASEGTPSYELTWHSDLAFTEPLLAISLYAATVPHDCTPTYFANGARAARLLPEESRRPSATRTAHHVYWHGAGGANAAGRNREADAPQDAWRSEHPVLLTNPCTGTQALYVCHMFTDRISGLDPDESESVLHAMFDLLYGPDNVYRHDWSPHDLLIWDNIAVQHRRGDTRQTEHRVMRRVCLSEKSLDELIPAPRG